MTKRRFDAYEIDQVVEYAEGYCVPLTAGDIAKERQADNYKADFWTLYGHITGEGVIAIGDFDTEDAAREILALIRAGSRDLQAALEAQTIAAQAVIDAWEYGDLAAAVRALAATILTAAAALDEQDIS